MPSRPRTDAGIPASVRFETSYGFVDEYGDRWHWDGGQVVRNPFVVAMLSARGAPFVIVEQCATPTKKIKE